MYSIEILYKDAKNNIIYLKKVIRFYIECQCDYRFSSKWEIWMQAQAKGLKKKAGTSAPERMIISCIVK